MYFLLPLFGFPKEGRPKAASFMEAGEAAEIGQILINIYKYGPEMSADIAVQLY